MTDFETHPVGTGKRIEELEAKLAGQDHDVHPVEMAARIKELDEQLENMCHLWAKADAGRQVLLGRVDDLEAQLATALIAELKGQDDD